MESIVFQLGKLNIKKLLILCFCLIHLASCEEKIPKEILSLVEKIIVNPKIIYEIEDRYPEYYDKNYIFKEIMMDKRKLANIEENIMREFNYDNRNLKIVRVSIDSIIIRRYNEIGYNLNIYNFYEFWVCRDNYCIVISYLKIEDRYKLFKINTSVFDPYKDGC